MNQPNEQTVLSVTDLNRQARVAIEDRFHDVWVLGEMSNFARPRSGHWYFTLKDERAQVRCAMFSNRNRAVQVQPGDGQLVLIRGRVSLYEGRGEFQIIVDHMEAAGEGALRQAFDQLKAKLATEGLFANAAKLPLPRYPEKIAVVTSATGAAFRDIRAVLARRYPALEILLVPCLVQGTAAEEQLLRALDRAIEQVPDIILLTRGGGSLEDLWPFNSERLARALHACRIPTVSAVGHEIDVTIADFVADVRAATPSAAAELVSPDRVELSSEFQGYERHLLAMFQRYVEHQHLRIENLALRISNPMDILERQKTSIRALLERFRRASQMQLHSARKQSQHMQARLHQQAPHKLIGQLQTRIKQSDADLLRCMTAKITQAKNQLGHQSRMLNGLSPLPTIDRGYALATTAQGTVVASVQDVQQDDLLTIYVSDGSIATKVNQTSPKTLSDLEK